MKKFVIPSIIIVAVIDVGYIGYYQMSFGFVDWEEGWMSQDSITMETNNPTQLISG